MSEETRLLSAMQTSGIRRVAVVDDAFDVPGLPESDAGAVLDHLRSPAFTSAIASDAALLSLYDDAVSAIEESEFDRDELHSFMAILFRHFVDTRQPDLDPARLFSRQRGDSLESVRGILTLLGRAHPPLELSKIGSSESEDLAKLVADIDLVFADFYLDPEVTAILDADADVLEDAKRKSQQMIQRIIDAKGRVPSIVLMSSKAVAAHASQFRKDLGASHGQVVAARFQFLEKSQLVLRDDQLEIQEPAEDALLDILQTFKFGEGVSKALELWKQSATAAISATAEAVAELELRDIAYLIRFRLEKEGQELLEYLEWLLGEYLIDEIGRRFYLSARQDESLRSVAETQKTVEGAFEGQSQSVAKIYHRVRVEEARAGRAPSLRMGDLFLEADSENISSVITPDCDVAARHGKRRAKRLLLVKGKVKPFDRKNPSAADFIMIGDAAKNIVWSKKDVETQSFEWSQDTEARRHIGTLRPMYAQQLQRVVLHDLGRVGVAPWPALYVDAEIELWYLDESRNHKRVSLPAGSTRCVVMPRRPDAPDEERHVVVFTRSLVRKIRQHLAGLPQENVVEVGRAHIAGLTDPGADSALSVACSGVELETKLPFSILVTQGKGDVPGKDGWAWIAVRVS